jgi:AraC-like DNA-binding protein
MADAEARQTFRDDPHGYAMYRQMTVTNNDRERKAIVSSVMAEMKHGVQVATKNDTEIRSQQLARVDMLAAAGRLANTSADMEVAADASNGLLEQTDTEHEAALDKLKERRAEELAKAKTEAEKKAAEDRFATAKAGIDAAAVAARAAIGKQTVDGITGIRGQDEAWARERATTLRQDFRNIFMQRYKAHHLAMGQSHELAWANAMAATRAAALDYFKTRIEAGQVSSVMYTLDELEKSGDEAYRRTNTKKNPTGTYDPPAYSFCRKSDLTALRRAAIAQVEEQRTLRNRQLIESQRSVKLEEQALLDDITKHSIGVADDGETPLYKTEEDRMKAQKLLYDRAKALEKRAGAVGYSVRRVFNALSNEPRKYLAMKERSERIAKKALGQQYVREQERMVEEELDRMLKAATTGGEVEIDVPVRDEQSGKDGTVKMRVDVHRAIVDAIDCARAHLSDSDFDREAFASEMGASASTLYNKLRSLTGLNVSAFIRDIRMKEAKRLAQTQPDLRVSDLAYKVGFKDPKYFSTCFKKEFGLQPSEFIEQMHGQKP